MASVTLGKNWQLASFFWDQIQIVDQLVTQRLSVQCPQPLSDCF